MKDLFPRTTCEFLEHGREVIVRCDDCNRNHRVDPEMLVLQFGEEFDCYASLAELQAQLRCDACGERYRLIYFHNARQTHFELVSLEEATISALELSAYVRARGEERFITQRARRRR
jgi:hypothetical protein